MLAQYIKLIQHTKEGCSSILACEGPYSVQRLPSITHIVLFGLVLTVRKLSNPQGFVPFGRSLWTRPHESNLGPLSPRIHTHEQPLSYAFLCKGPYPVQRLPFIIHIVFFELALTVRRFFNPQGFVPFFEELDASPMSQTYDL